MNILVIHRTENGDNLALNKSAVILSGGFSRRFGQDKGILQLGNKPLIKHVLDAINNIVDDKIVVLSSGVQAENYEKIIDSNVKLLIDSGDKLGPLVGVLTGFREVHQGYVLLLPCDTPFISPDVLSLLFELCTNEAAVIPRWPNGYIEPMQAVYRANSALEAAEYALKEGKLEVRSMVEELSDVRYVPIHTLQKLDPKLKTFFNINTPSAFKKAEAILKRLNRCSFPP